MNVAQRVLASVAARVRHRDYFRGRDRLVEAVLRLAQRAGPPVVIEIDGFSLQLDMSDGLSRALWFNPAFPQATALRALCTPGSVVVDVGASIGYMALRIGREVGPSGRVIAIEPSRQSFELLQANVARNLSDRIVTLRAACDETDGEASFFVSDESEEISSLGPVDGRSHRETVPVWTLASLTKRLGVSPDVVKIDVEGAEWRVLKGLFSGGIYPRGLVVEVFPPNANRFGYAPSEMCRWLRDQGYHLTVASDTERFEYSDALVDAGSELLDVVATR